MTTRAPSAAPSPIAFPWDDAMRAGLGVLRLSPREFWAMTPREFAAALGGVTGRNAIVAALGRQGLADLMRRYPDRMETRSDV